MLLTRHGMHLFIFLIHCKNYSVYEVAIIRKGMPHLHDTQLASIPDDDKPLMSQNKDQEEQRNALPAECYLDKTDMA